MTPVLWHVVRAVPAPQEVAEDVVQTTWLALVRRRAADRGARRRRWLADHDRPPRGVAGGQGQRPGDAGRGRRPGATAARQGSAEAEVAARDGDDRLWAAVERLPERCRRLLRVVAFENRPDYRELAADLGMPVGSIGPTRGRCLAKLRVAFERRG